MNTIHILVNSTEILIFHLILFLLSKYAILFMFATSRKTEGPRYAELTPSVLFCAATEFEKSLPVNIPDAAKRKKKKRTRATDSFTGTFDGNKSDIIV